MRTLRITFTQLILEDLLEAGANVNIQNNTGDTPLHIAMGFAKSFIESGGIIERVAYRMAVAEVLINSKNVIFDIGIDAQTFLIFLVTPCHSLAKRGR